ncbi:MAG: ABC transporter ATP-binding protein [Desulfovibrionaceae bacterium]
MSLYQIQNLLHTYNTRTVLGIKECTIEKGITTILGKNGSGKTTLLKIMSLLLNPTKGIIFYNSKKIENSNAHALRKEITLLLQDSYLLKRNVKENLAYPLYIRSLPIQESILIKALHTVGLHKDFLYMDAKKLSGGEKQRVALASRLLCQPKVLLLDEPTASLDMPSVTILQNIIEDYSKHNSVIIVSHDTHFINSLHTRKIFLENTTY